MVKRKEGVCIIHDQEYLEAENEAYRILIENGFLPQGANKGFKSVCVMRIENEHTPNEKRDVWNFQNWQEAVEKLCN